MTSGATKGARCRRLSRESLSREPHVHGAPWGQVATPWEVSDLLRRSVFPVDVLRTAATFLMDNNRDPGGTVHSPASSAFGGSGVLLGPFGSSAIFLRRFSLRLPVPLPPAAAVSSSLVLTHVSKPKGGSHEEPSELPELSTSVLGGPRSAQRRERERTWATVSVQRGWVGQGAPGPAGAGHAALSVDRRSVHADAAAPNAAPQRLTRRCGGPRNAAACKSTSRRQTQSCSVQVDAAARSAAPQRASRLTCLPCPFHCPGSRHWQSRRHRPP